MTQFLTDEALIKAWLKEYGIKRYIIRQNKSSNKSGNDGGNSFIVDVQENVVIGHGNLKFLPVKFGRIDGSFNLYGHKGIKNFIGGPSIVASYYMCMANDLQALDYLPEFGGGEFLCHTNPALSHYEHLIGASEDEIYENPKSDYSPDLGDLGIGRIEKIKIIVDKYNLERGILKQVLRPTLKGSPVEADNIGRDIKNKI